MGRKQRLVRLENEIDQLKQRIQCLEDMIELRITLWKPFEAPAGAFRNEEDAKEFLENFRSAGAKRE